MLHDKEDVEGVVHHQGLSYVPEYIKIELTSHFGIEKSSRDGNEGGARRGDFDRRSHPKLHGDFDVTFQVTRWRSGHYSFARKSQ